MDPVTIDPPRAAAVPVVASVPHAGTYVPPAMRERLDPAYRHLPDTDWHVDRLFDFLPDLGVAVVVGTHSRYVADPNRPLTEPLFGPFSASVVPAESFEGRPLYRIPPDADEVRGRIDSVHRPYHRAVQGLVDDRVERFGRAILLDLHSFDTVMPEDVCLGDDEGRLATDATQALHDALGARFDVVRNKVWTGGHISRRYGGRPNVQAVQVEVNHAAYLDEEELGRTTPPTWRRARFAAARERLRDALTEAVTRLSAA